MNCFLKKLFGKKCDDKKPDNLENKEEAQNLGSDQLSPESEFKSEEHKSEEKREEHNQ